MVTSVNNQPTPEQLEAEIQALVADIKSNPAHAQSDLTQIMQLEIQLDADKIAEISKELAALEAKIKADPSNAAEYENEIQILNTQLQQIVQEEHNSSSFNPPINLMNQKC
jgi:uncharacterized coiled-coil DUF342 family protein